MKNERLEEEMTQDMINDFYAFAKEEWDKLLKEYQMSDIEFICSEHQQIAMDHLIEFQAIKNEAELRGFSMGKLVEGVEVEMITDEDEWDQLQDDNDDLSPYRVLH